MAGVRNNPHNFIKPIAQPRGLPHHLSAVTDFEANVVWKNDSHSHSWLGGLGIKRLFESDIVDSIPWFEHEQLGYLCGNGWGDWYDHRKDYPAQIEDIRLVFWFDN
jgi:hypothetical protein